MDGTPGSFFDPSRLSKAAAEQYSSSDSESDDERLLPGQDHGEFGDFNPRKKRRIGGNNKEKAALGIFGSDSDDEKPGSKWKRKTLRSKGMNFVTTAAKEKSDEDEEASEDNRPVLGNGQTGLHDADEMSDESDDAARTGLDIARGFARPANRESSPEEDERPHFQTNFQGGGVLGVGFVPSSATEPQLNEQAAKSKGPPKNKPQQSAFGGKGGKLNAKSFGARMMAKMGYVEGKGLGREGQGRNVIIEANLRPQGIGLGAVKEKSEQERKEEKRQAELRGETVVDSDEEEKKKKRARAKRRGLGTAQSSAGSTPRRQKKKYLTAEELKTAAPGLHIPEAFTPILDMTGPGGKMLTSTSGIMTPTSGEPESKEVIEARKLVKHAQADLLAFTEEWKSLEERKKWIDLELSEKQREVEDLRTDFAKLQVFSHLVSGQLSTATSFDEAMAALKQAGDLEASTPDVADIIVAAIHPFWKDWDPMTEPDRFSKDLMSLSGILLKQDGKSDVVDRWNTSSTAEDGVYRRHRKATTTYETMMYKTWLPQVLAAVRNWDPFTPTPMLNIMESWNDLLPPFVRAQVMDNIGRRLDTTLSDWNPRVRKQSHHLPHMWLFPWLQYLPPYHLDPKGTGLVADVRRKFRHLIDAWEYERGVVPGLSQWQEVFGTQWQSLMMSHVLPSMGKYLQRNFRVDPADQEPYMPILSGILKWSNMVGSAVIAEVLVQHMFPMWNSKLQEWLSLEEVNLAEVADWYSWWRGIVLKDLASSHVVGKELDKGLQIMNMV